MQTIRRKFGERLRRFTLVTVVVAAGLLIGPRAYAQAPDDDPAARAMRRIQAAVDERAASAELALAASKLVNQSAESRKQGKSEEAHESLQQAEMMVAASVPAQRGVLTEALLRRIREEQTALSPAAPVTTSRLDWPGLKQGGRIPRLVLARYNSHRDSLTRILAEERLPVAALSVALIESRFNPQALSPKGALGIWQLMPATARRYGLTVAPGNDHRLHPEHATRAAARYLRDLHQMFGDWKLALAAYNAGEGRVQRAIDRAGVRDFDELARRRLLPLETRNYVPAVLAAWAQMNAAEAREPVEE